MTKKAIKIDLSDFFDDERKFCYILVDFKWESVASLQERVQILFELDSVRFLSEGMFLHPQEPIEIVQFCKDLKAYAPKEIIKTKKKKSTRNKNIGTNSLEEWTHEALHDRSQKKRKSINLRSSPSNKVKRSKNNTDIEHSQILDHEFESKISKKNKSKVPTLTPDSEEPINGNELSESKFQFSGSLSKEQPIVAESSDEKSTKRLSPKGNRITEISEHNADEILSVSSTIKSPPHLNESAVLEKSEIDANFVSKSSELKNPFKKSKSSRAHIYFDENCEISSPITQSNSKLKQKNNKERKKVIIFRCALNDVNADSATEPQKPRIFNLQAVNTCKTNTSQKKQTIEIQEEMLLPPLSINELLHQNKINKPDSEKEDANSSKEIQQTDTTDHLNETRSLNNSTTISGGSNTIIDKTVEEKDEGQENATNLEVSKTFKIQNKSKIMEETNGGSADNTSMMSVTCVDLSIDLDDDIEEEKKQKQESQQEKHDLTTDYDDQSKSSILDVHEISEIIDLNESEDNCNTTSNSPSIKQGNVSKNFNIHTILPLATDLIDLPNLKDILIFKIPYINSSKVPVQTQYIAGEVEYINRRTKMIKIKVTDGLSELHYVPAQYICALDDSLACNQYLQLKTTDMHEPKLFSNSSSS